MSVSMKLKDIAQEAGVSISTVSRVLNDKHTNAASKEVQERIWAVVRKYGYVPNASARNLRKKNKDNASPRKNGNIACLFARTNAFTDIFFSSLARSIEQEVFKRGYIIKYSFSAFDIDNTSTLSMIEDNQVDGVVVLGRGDKKLFQFLKKHFRCVAYTGLNPVDANYDQIICDAYGAGCCAMEHLLSLGHTHVGYIGDMENENIYRAYSDSLSKHNILAPNRMVHKVKSLSSESGYLGAQTLFSKNPDLTALFCGNDITAIGAMKAAKEAKIKIPHDLSLISIDDIETVQYLSPMLTTVHVPVDEMGQMVAKILIDRIEGEHTIPLKLYLPFYLAVRESCCRPPAKE